MATFAGEPTFNAGAVQVNTTAVRLAREAGYAWRELSFDQRVPFVRQAEAEFAARPAVQEPSWLEKWETAIAAKMKTDNCARSQAIDRLCTNLASRDLRMRAVGETARRSGWGRRIPREDL